MSQMLKSSGAMSAATLISRVFGMVREMVYARFMGDGPVASAFILAFQIPNLFRRLLGEGALSAAFIPIFKEKEKTAGDLEMWKAANAVISGLVVASAVCIGLAVVALSVVLALGSLNGETRLMLQLLRLMFPYMLMVCLTAVFMGMLNARGHFFIPAMGATMLNVIMIGSVLFLAPRLGRTLETQIFGLAIGVLVAGIAQAAFQLPTLRHEGFKYAWVPPWKNETVREVVIKMVPGMLGVAAFQINVLLTQGMSYWVDPRIVASFNYAVRLMELPQGVFGISLATYLLATLSGLAAEKKYAEFRSTLLQGLGYIMFVNLLASALLLTLAEPIVRLIFERGHFDSMSTQRATGALVCLAPGLAAFSVVNILVRAFYALGDTKTPMQISIVCLVLNLVFAFWLISPLKQAGLGLANTLSSILNVWLLGFAMRRKLTRLELAALRPAVLGMFAAAILAGGAAAASSRGWEQWVGHQGWVRKAGAVFVPMTIASLFYWVTTLWLKIPLAWEMVGWLRWKPGKRRR